MWTASQGGDTTYRLVLGSFANREDATQAADMLLNAGTVQQSRIIKLPDDD
jgi:cell division protein FtsN